MRTYRLSLVVAVIAASGLVSPVSAGGGPICRGRAPTIVGTKQAEVIIGTPGDDVISGLGGADTIRGLEGDDVICGGGAVDEIYGGAGKDRAFGGHKGAVIHGGDGNDILAYGTLFGGEGNDLVKHGISSGGPGDDVIKRKTASYAGAAGPVSVDMTAGVVTGEGTDRLVEVFRVNGSEHDDTFFGKGVSCLMHGGGGEDQMDARGCFTVGDAGDDTITGPDAGVGFGGQHLAGGSGDDTINDGSHDTLIVGGPGADILNGGEGNDVILGWFLEAPEDPGLEGDEVVTGGPGDDTIAPGRWTTDIDGGTGTDSLRWPLHVMHSENFDGVTVDLQAGTASGFGNHTLADVENAYGTLASDTLIGTDGDNLLMGEPPDDPFPSDDVLVGAGGNDILVGAGDDQISGGAGIDELQLHRSQFFEDVAPLHIDLADGTVEGPWMMTIGGFENVIGSQFADIIIGTSGPNMLQGHRGDDVVNGQGGNDVLNGNLISDGGTWFGNAEEDTADGGPDTDRCTEFATTQNCEA